MCYQDPCDSYSCNSHGTCSLDTILNPSCACDPNYSGDHCEKCEQGFVNYPTCSPVCSLPISFLSLPLSSHTVFRVLVILLLAIPRGLVQSTPLGWHTARASRTIRANTARRARLAIQTILAVLPIPRFVPLPSFFVPSPSLSPLRPPSPPPADFTSVSTCV